MVKSRQRVTPLLEPDKQKIISSPETDDSVRLDIITDSKASTGTGRRYGNAKRKLKAVSVFSNTVVEEDGAGDPLFELWPTPKNKHLALLYYFFKLAENPNTIASFEYIDQLLKAGADINAQDRVGQTLLHEVARDWGPDIAKYLISKGAEVDVPDEKGRTPLHVACRTENDSVVRCLLDGGADRDANTTGEHQTPLHYAARHDAAQVIEVLHEYDVHLNPRDYKGRTPLLLAAELDRSVAALKLLEYGAKAGIIDKTGLHTLCAMVNKMPGVAYRALDQFHVTNRANRQQFFFLNYLEPDPDVDEATFLPMSVLGTVVDAEELKLMGHPVIREMIKIKWSRFGQRNCLLNLVIYAVYLLSWTCVVFIYQPWKLEDTALTKENMASSVYIVVSVYIAVIFFLYLLIEEFIDLYRSETTHFRYKQWRSKQIERDLQYVPTKLTEEKEYLESQAERVRTSRSSYTRDVWNWYDWITYISMIITAVFVLICLHGSNSFKTKYQVVYPYFALWTSRMMCLTLILIWIKLFKFVRVYSFLGPFVVILMNTVKDIAKIVFVFFVFFVPTVAVFFQFYYISGDSYYGGIREMLFTVYRMLLVDDYGYDDIRDYKYNATVDEKVIELAPETWWTDILISYWLMFGAIIILNLFIALMSDTFQRVFDNASEVALLERASIIVSIEDRLPERRKRDFLRYLKEKCAPIESYYDDDMADDDDGEVKRYAEQTFDVVKSIQSQVQEWRQESGQDLKLALRQQLHDQQKQMRRLEETVQHLRRVMEAQSRFRQGPAPKAGSNTIETG